ncbi:unnamed protein product, partial [Phaeothamnion confervicola]
IEFVCTSSRVGTVLVASSAAGERAACAILLGDNATTLREDLERLFPRAELRASKDEIGGLLKQVVSHINNACGSELPKLDIRGTPFQKRVWAELSNVPAGTTTTYAAIARAIGAPRAVRAVGRAIGANRLAVAVPCHRAILSTGGLSGYRWGTDRKRALLLAEGVKVDSLLCSPVGVRKTARSTV